VRGSNEALLGPEVDRILVRLNVHELARARRGGRKSGQDVFQVMDEKRSISLALRMEFHGQHPNLKNEVIIASLGLRRTHLQETEGGASFNSVANRKDQSCICTGHVIDGVHIGNALRKNIRVLVHRRMVLLTVGEARHAVWVGSSALPCCCTKQC